MVDKKLAVIKSSPLSCATNPITTYRLSPKCVKHAHFLPNAQVPSQTLEKINNLAKKELQKHPQIIEYLTKRGLTPLAQFWHNRMGIHPPYNHQKILKIKQKP